MTQLLGSGKANRFFDGSHIEPAAVPGPSKCFIFMNTMLFLVLTWSCDRSYITVPCSCSGWKGNLCERSLASRLSLFVLLPCAALAVYVLLLQTFVLKLEFILAAILLVFYGFEFLFGLLSLFAFSRWAALTGNREFILHVQTLVVNKVFFFIFKYFLFHTAELQAHLSSPPHCQSVLFFTRSSFFFLSAFKKPELQEKRAKSESVTFHKWPSWSSVHSWTS